MKKNFFIQGYMIIGGAIASFVNYVFLSLFNFTINPILLIFPLIIGIMLIYISGIYPNLENMIQREIVETVSIKGVEKE